MGILLVCFALLGAAGPLPAATEPAVSARNLQFSRLASQSGMGDAPINAIVQDQQGYLWYGTQEGLHRYDGTDVVTFEHSFNDPLSLASDWIWSLCVGRDGTLWVGTEGGGLAALDRRSQDFRHYRHDHADPTSLSSDRVRVVFQDREGALWIGTDGGGLNRFDQGSGTFTHFRHNPSDPGSLPHDTVLAITEDSAGRLWVGTNGGGLAQLDRATGNFRSYAHNPLDPESLSGNHIRTIYEDKGDQLWGVQLWVGTYEGGLNLLDPQSGVARRFVHDPQDPTSLSDNRVRDVFRDDAGTLWVGTDNGLNEWRPRAQAFVRYGYDVSNVGSLSDNRVTTLFQDRGGVLWVGTYYGLNKWNYLSDAFAYFDDSGSPLSLSSNIVTAVEETADGQLWVGTYGGGLNRVDLAANTVRVYRAAGPGGGEGLPNDKVMSLYVDARQSVWIGTRGGGLSRLDPASGQFTHYRHDAADDTTISSNNVSTITAGAEGTLWVGTYGGGLNRLDTRSGRFTAYRHDAHDQNSPGSDRILALHRDGDGVLWVGSEDGGLSSFDEATGAFSQYRRDPDNPDSLSADSAWAIHEGSDGSLWIGTNGGGLNRWRAADRAAGKAVFEKYHKGNGLSSDTVQAILEDADGTLWLSSNRGLVQLDPGTGSTRYFGRDSGLNGSEFNFAARLRSHSGRLLFGGTSGLVAFDPDQIRTNQRRPEIALGIFDRQGALATRYSTGSGHEWIELEQRNNRITFQFAALDYSAPEKNRYRYKLEGFDRGWSETQKYTRATYTNLPAGNYRFTVQAANSDGVWNERGVSMQLQVNPDAEQFSCEMLQSTHSDAFANAATF